MPHLRGPGPRVADIFVSYTSSDRDWAFWIGQELEKLGHVAHVHEWELPVGGDIPAWMEERVQKADQVLCVVSAAYLTKDYSSWERRSAQWAAQRKRQNFVVPVFVEDCEAPVTFAHIKRCDLSGLSEDDARALLKSDLAPVGKPLGPARFPGAKSAPLRFPGEVQPEKSQPARQQAIAHESKPFALSNIPINVPRHFLGRDDALEAIDAALKRGEGRLAIAALHGLRGVGKTTLAAAYAERHRQIIARPGGSGRKRNRPCAPISFRSARASAGLPLTKRRHPRWLLFASACATRATEFCSSMTMRWTRGTLNLTCRPESWCEC
jgi:TIR domain-containing protein